MWHFEEFYFVSRRILQIRNNQMFTNVYLFLFILNFERRIRLSTALTTQRLLFFSSWKSSRIKEILLGKSVDHSMISDCACEFSVSFYNVPYIFQFHRTRHSNRHYYSVLGLRHRTRKPDDFIEFVCAQWKRIELPPLARTECVIKMFSRFSDSE